MRNPPPAIKQVLRHFEPMFSERVWEWAKILPVGAILTPSKRIVSSALQVMGLNQERQYHPQGASDHRYIGLVPQRCVASCAALGAARQSGGRRPDNGTPASGFALYG